MSDIQVAQQYTGIGEYLWPKLAPAFVDIVRQVAEVAPGVSVTIDQSPNSYLGYQGGIGFTFRAKKGYLILDVNCKPDLDSSESFPALDCGSQVYQFERGRDDVPNTILGEGPHLSVPLRAQDAMRRALDQWADATVVFIRSRADLIQKSVESIQ